MKWCAISLTKFSTVCFLVGLINEILLLMKFSTSYFRLAVNCRMSERIHVLAQQLFGKPSVAECNLEEIRQLTERYPYFAPAQFLLLEKLKQDSSPDYHSQLQKAVLYYHN